MEVFMGEFTELLRDPLYTYPQRLIALAKYAENSESGIELSEEAQAFADRDIIFDMNEGASPYRPRYVVVNFDKFMKQGSKFLMLDPPNDIWEAVSNLMAIYHHIPSVVGVPVYIGHLDRLLEPYITDENEARKAIHMLLIHVDRTISDSFCHADIGPHDTRAGRIILELSAEMQRPVPNMSLIYNKNTPDDFARLAINTGMITSKPSFVNDDMYAKDWDEYAIVSCYNALPLGGGGLTLGRLNLKNLAEASNGPQDLMDNMLPRAVAAQCEQMDKRDTFIIEDSRFFQNSFLSEEGLIEQERFVGMFGLVGLAECVNNVLALNKQNDRFGHGERANAFGEEILEAIHRMITAYKPKYGRFCLHGQVGISTDIGVTPNVRVPVGEEPPMPQHLAVTARMQKYFNGGVGELFPFDNTAKRNPQAVLDIIKGAFSQNMRYISYYSNDADVIRVTGYMVKRSDIESYDEGKSVLGNSTVLGSGATKGLRVYERKVRSTENGTKSAGM